MRTCRLCHHPTTLFLKLPPVPLPEALYRRPPQTITRYPLGLAHCRSCHHIQLTHQVRPYTIYKHHYHYDYSYTPRAHWQQLARSLYHRFPPGKNLVVDIGANTGVLLQEFHKLKAQVLGIDPSPIAKRAASIHQLPLINNFFSLSTALSLAKTYGLAYIITCTNTLDHVSNLHDFTLGLKHLLHPNGTIVIEIPHFLSFYKKLNHVVYHQQIDYCHLTPLIPFFAQHQLYIHHTQTLPIHGGSLRLFISHQPQPVTKQAISPSLNLQKFSLLLLKRYHQFGHRITKLSNQGKVIAAVGASAKGITLLNICRLSYPQIRCISDISPQKIGRFTSTGIPIVTDQQLLKENPDYLILLAYNFPQILTQFPHPKSKIIFPFP